MEFDTGKQTSERVPFLSVGRDENGIVYSCVRIRGCSRHCIMASCCRMFSEEAEK
jgi:hypothetical protein